MTEKKIIAVVGATGSQGGGLVRAILADPDREFAARVLTRNSQSGKAQELAASGAEVVEADLDDEASLVRAFEGTHGAFIVTNYWADRTPDGFTMHVKAFGLMTRHPVKLEVLPEDLRDAMPVDAGHPTPLWRRRAGADRGRVV
jgi:NAD(P)-dependent dehydrogenase (short-subunit alcohol dehydrogenase family)